jgi:hypothetical protein
MHARLAGWRAGLLLPWRTAAKVDVEAHFPVRPGRRVAEHACDLLAERLETGNRRRRTGADNILKTKLIFKIKKKRWSGQNKRALIKIEASDGDGEKKKEERIAKKKKKKKAEHKRCSTLGGSRAIRGSSTRSISRSRRRSCCSSSSSSSSSRSRRALGRRGRRRCGRGADHEVERLVLLALDDLVDDGRVDHKPPAVDQPLLLNGRAAAPVHRILHVQRRRLRVQVDPVPVLLEVNNVDR